MVRKTAKRRQTKKKVMKRKTMKTKAKRVIRKRKGGAEEDVMVVDDIPEAPVDPMVRDIQRFEAEDDVVIDFMQLANDAADHVLKTHPDDNTRDQIRQALKEKLQSLDNQVQDEIDDLTNSEITDTDFKVDAQVENLMAVLYEAIRAGH